MDQRRIDCISASCLLVTVFVLFIVGPITFVYLWYTCYFSECCCSDTWITQDIDAIHTTIKENVFGQHLVHGVIYAALKGHAKFHPEKPLVLSFHGSTGTGKNFVSQHIVNGWFKKGMGSKYVTMLTGTKDFPFVSLLDEYKKKLQELIVRHTTSCKHHIFIFDEIDSFPPGLLDSIRTYLEYSPNVDGIDYRNTIFIFLSNTGDAALKNLAADYYIHGWAREDLKLQETEKLMVKEIFSFEGAGLTRSRLIDSNLISHYVPFLPLEEEHVRNCIRKQLSDKHHQQQIDDNVIDEVILELQFDGPYGRQIFSVKGCKNVGEKVNLVLIKKMFPPRSEL